MKKVKDKRKLYFRNSIKFIFALFFSAVFIIQSAMASQPPTKEQLIKYKKDGSLKRRLDYMKSLKNDQISPHLLNKGNQYVNRVMRRSTVSTSAQPDGRITPRQGGLHSVGEQKMFVLLLAFKDYPAPANQSKSDIYEHVFGDGDESRYPKESVTNFYKRASYGKLSIVGEVLPWYTIDANRSESDDIQAMIKEGLKYHEENGVDFSEYDNNSDGIIDAFSVIWTGPKGEWASTWWGTQRYFYQQSFTISDKNLGVFTWQSLGGDNSNEDFNPTTLIHETGHALGLADYYDYDPLVGPAVEIPVNDMMKNNTGDHNAFSKFMLGWIEPKVLGSGSQTVDLLPSSTNPDAFIIMPDLTIDKGLSEYFVVQNRDSQKNDKPNIDDSGLQIWHVDATSTNVNYVFNNSYSQHSLIKLMSPSDDSNHYQPGDSFTTLTEPSSVSYQLRSEGVEITNIIDNETSITFDAEIAPIPSISFSGVQDYEILQQDSVLVAEVSSENAINKVVFTINNDLEIEDTEAPFELDFAALDFDAYDLDGGKLFIAVKAITASAQNEGAITLFMVPENTGIVVVDLSFTQDSYAVDVLEQFTFPVVKVPEIPVLTPEQVPAIFIIHHNYSEFTSTQWQRLNNYLNAGGNIYYENELWSVNAENLNAQWRALGVQHGEQFTYSHATVKGRSGSIVDGLEYDFNFPLTFPLPAFTQLEISSSQQSNSEHALLLWQYGDTEISNTISNEIGLGKLIVTTGKLSWFNDSENNFGTTLMLKYFDFFGIDSVLAEDLDRGAVQFKKASATVDEDANTLTVTVERVDGSEHWLSFTVASEDDSAKSGAHYSAVNKTMTFSAGETSLSFDVEIIDNDATATDKKFTLYLTSESLVQDGHSLAITINDDDAEPAVEDKPSDGSSGSGGSTSYQGIILMIMLLLLRLSKLSKSSRMRMTF